MTVEDHLFPDPGRPKDLMQDLCSLFSALPFVIKVIGFGSLVGTSSDRWSDIDLLVMTSKRSDYAALLSHLRRNRSLLYHSPLTTQVEPSGGNVLGVSFQDESVFHCLDLNFISLPESKISGSLDRFEGRVDLFVVGDVPPAGTSESDHAESESVHPDEDKISRRIHFTKKALKHFLRQEGSLEDVKVTSENLKSTLAQYPQDIEILGGNICALGRTYLEIAEYLLVHQ